MMELNDNPYTSPKSTDSQSKNQHRDPSARDFRWSAYFLVSLGISILPVYGFYTLAGQDSQETVLWLILAWLLSIVNAIVCIVRALLLKKANRPGSMLGFVVSVILAAIMFVGFFGIVHSVGELWAG